MEIIEGYLEHLSYATVEQRIRSIAPDLLGVHMVYHWQGDGELYSLLQRMNKMTTVAQNEDEGVHKENW